MSADNNGSTNNSDTAGATDATPVSTTLEFNDTPPRAKINISLGGKKKKTSTTNKSINNNNLISSHDGQSSLLGEEYSTIAEEAEIISQKRKEEGTILVIPCAQGANEEEKRKHPLLASRLALLQKGTDAVTSANDDNDDGKVQHINVAIKTNGEVQTELEDEVVKQLIESANQSQKIKEYDGDNTTPTGRGLVIAAPSKNNLITQQTNTTLNEDEQFKQELAHHASDVDPTSSVYANVAIGDFGSALLRGMGWKGGDNKNYDKSGNKNEEIRPRPHRLGLGAAPLPLPSTTSASSKGGIHRRARRPDELKRDEERQKQQDEAERIAAEKKRLDVQVTLQPGSVVHVRDEASDENKRARVAKTAGVPGLNRILVQMEGSTEDISVAKSSVKLCSWDELKRRPFQKLSSNKPTEGERQRNESSSSQRKRSRSYDIEGDRRSRKDTAKHSNRSDRDRYNERHHEDLSDDDSRDRKCRSKKHKRKKRHHRDKSYSRSRSPDHYDYSRDRNKHESHHKSSSHKYQSSESQKQDHLNWIIPNIRVRLISKKIPAYYLQKGVVQDVTRSQSSPKAVLLMDNGQVIDKVPERYLETALPKTCGNIIVLEGKHQWKKGRLLERSSDDGYGVIQFTEDLEVVNISLDSIAEWCLNDDE
jgi:hypothetical protein